MGAGDVRVHFLPAHSVLYLFRACWQADLEWCGVVLVLGCEQQVHHCWDVEYYDRVGTLVRFMRLIMLKSVTDHYTVMHTRRS